VPSACPDEITQGGEEKKEGRVSERKRKSCFLGKTGGLPTLSSSVRPIHSLHHVAVLEI